MGTKGPITLGPVLSDYAISTQQSCGELLDSGVLLRANEHSAADDERRSDGRQKPKVLIIEPNHAMRAGHRERSKIKELQGGFFLLFE